jgi:chromosome segregation ATPase
MWTFRTDARILDLTRKLKSAANVTTELRAELAQANRALDAERRAARRTKDTYDRFRAAEEGVEAQRKADLNALREHVEALREQLAACQGWICEPANALRLRLKATSDDWAHLQRRWDGHAAVCPVAQAADDHTDDKAKENR